MSALALGLCISGFVALCLAMEKHQLELYGKAQASVRRRRLWRWLGWLLLAAALWLAAHALGWNKGPLLWLGGLSLTGIVIGLGVLPYRPKILVPLAWLAPVPGLLSLLWPG